MWLLTFTIAKYAKIIKNVGNTGKMESVFSELGYVIFRKKN